jgi:hypothetical protein
MTLSLKIILYSTFIFSLFSCVKKKDGEQKTSTLSNFLTISDNEDKGVKAVISAYGGYCEYLLGLSANSDKKKGKYFKLKLSKSDIVETYKTHPEILTSGIAYLFYSNLIEEKTAYTDIHSQLIFADGKELTYEYPVSILEKVHQKMNLIDSIVQLMRTKKISKLNPILDNQSIFKYNKDELISSLEKVGANFGNIQAFIIHGYKINKLENGMELLHVLGVLKRDNRNNEFRVDMDLNSKSNQVFMIDYKFDYSDLFH